MGPADALIGVEFPDGAIGLQSESVLGPLKLSSLQWLQREIAQPPRPGAQDGAQFVCATHLTSSASSSGVQPPFTLAVGCRCRCALGPSQALSAMFRLLVAEVC